MSISQRDGYGLVQGRDAVCSEGPVLKAFGAGKAMRGYRVPYLAAYTTLLLEQGNWSAVYESDPPRWNVEGTFRKVHEGVWTFYLYESTRVVEGIAPSAQGSDPLEQLGFGDVTRRAALNSGVAHAFQGIVEQRAQRQAFPSALKQAMDSSPGHVFDPQTLSVNVIEDFLREGNQSGFYDIRPALVRAADFLREPHWEGGVFSPQQDFIRRFLEEEG